MIRDIVFCLKISWKASKLYTVLHFLTEIASVFFPVLISFDIKFIVDSLTQKNINLYAILGLFIIYALQSLTSQVNQYVYSMQNDIIDRYLQWDMLDISSRMQMIHYDDHEYYDAYQAVKNDLYVIWFCIVDSVSVISYTVLMIDTVIMIFPYLKWITILLIVVSIPAAVSEYYFTEKLYAWRLSHIEQERKMDYLYDISTQRRYAFDIRLYDLGKKFLRNTKLIWEAFISNKRCVIKKRVLLNYLFGLVEILVSIFALYHVVTLIIEGKYTVGDFTLYIGLLEQMRSAIQTGISSSMDLYDKKLKIDYYINFKTNVKEEKSTGNKKLSNIEKIEFSNVSFKYPKMDVYALKDISFVIEKSQKICMVGENGAGKSTIIKLLLGFYEPTSGEIFINDESIREYDIHSLRKHFGCFFQNGEPFAFTVEENITLDIVDIDNNRFSSSIDLVTGRQFIDRLPQKENTYISREFSEDGVVLSGGQNQKVMLARVFYRNEDVWLLDEPSAALDPKAENLLFEALDKQCDKTLLFVSHRLSNVFMADKIIVIENGQIEAEGKHEYLMKNSKSYRTLYNYQAQKYEH